MSKFAKHGTCPFCFAKVWKDPGEIMRPVLDFEPLAPSEVIPTLKARRPLYRRGGGDSEVAYYVWFTHVDALSLARHLKAGGAPPTNLYVLHKHQAFWPAKPEPPSPIPPEPGF